MDQPFLGLYLIVRDAEKTIDALLDSVFPPKGPAFDEVVIVDTGSKDATIEKICLRLNLPVSVGGYMVYPGKPFTKIHTYGDGPCRLVLTGMKWIDDFAAARNFAFRLGTAKWRMWLDADDQFPLARNLKPTIQRTEQTHPNNNCVFMKYDYAPNDTVQDRIRVVRWADGWRWENAIHEELVRFPAGSRHISQYADLIVHHRPEAGHGQRSLDRNIKMCERILQKAEQENDTRTIGMMSYYLGIYAAHQNQDHSALSDLRVAADMLGPTNLGCLSLVEMAKIYLEQENWGKAAAVAGEAVAVAPEMHDGWGALGIALTEGKHFIRAGQIFDRLSVMPPPALESNRDVVFNDGLVWSFAAKAYLGTGEVEKAGRALANVKPAVSMDERVWMHFSRAMSDYYKALGWHYTRQLADFLIWNNEPVKALKVLEANVLPSNVDGNPAVSAAKNAIWEKMQQLKSWADYKRVYAAECNEVFDRDQQGVEIIRKQGRAEQALRWAKGLPKEGPPFHLYVIGIHGGWIEEDVMDANPRIHLTACDVNPNANEAIRRLTAKFPGRVSSHVVRTHHYDWIPEGRVGTFDAVFCFEVIEHVPDDRALLDTIYDLLKPGGELLLSTPIAEYWVAPDATLRHHWHQHVRAYQPHQLWDMLTSVGFTGDLYATDNRILFFAHMRRGEFPHRLTPVTIVCPGAPQGFDPSSPSEGHTGGSEEAVIHLAPRLAALGHHVEVYVENKPDRPFTPHVVQSVLWRDAKEFDPHALLGSVLVWRSPRYAAWVKKMNPKLRVLNWLHDVSYGAPPADYETVDGTIVLSQFHGKAITKNDGFAGPFMYGCNGIDRAEMESALARNEGKRKEHTAVYAQAPNRGLDLLLEAWPLVREKISDATLKIFYGWETTEKMMRSNPQLQRELAPLLEDLRDMISELAEDGVTFVGGVTHERLHDELAQAQVWTYPGYNFDETYCITAVKAQALGARPIVCDRGAIPEVIKAGDIVEPEFAPKNVADAIITAMGEELDPDQDAKLWALEQSWENAAKKFETFFTPKVQRVSILANAFGRPFDFLSLHDPKPGYGQLGGSEEAVITLSEALAKQGMQVTVYAPGNTTNRSPDGVHWASPEKFDPRAAHGTLLVWRNPKEAPKYMGHGYPVYNWLMDPSYAGVTDDEYAAVTGTIGLTESHRKSLRLFDKTEPKVWTTLHNGLQLDELPPLSLQNDKGRNMRWVMWATSPDRGLIHLLRGWSAIRERVPDAQLHIFYGIDAVKARAAQDEAFAKAYAIPELIELLDGRMEKDGVRYHGAATRSELMAWHVRCGIFAYWNTGFQETFCISAVKAQACGMWPVVSDQGALPEVTAGMVVKADEAFADKLVQVLLDPPSFERRKSLADATRKSFSSESAARELIALLQR